MPRSGRPAPKARPPDRRLRFRPTGSGGYLWWVFVLPAEIRALFGFSWDPAREALLRSALLQLRYGSRFWLDAVRLHPAARMPAGERYGSLAG